VNTFLQRQVSADMRGRVFGNLYAGIGAAAAASYLLGALLLELTDPRTTFIVAGGGGLLVTVATAAAAARAHRRTQRSHIQADVEMVVYPTYVAPPSSRPATG
jgi:MFS family permease